jgi:hypothetical protein
VKDSRAAYDSQNVSAMSPSKRASLASLVSLAALAMCRPALAQELPPSDLAPEAEAPPPPPAPTPAPTGGEVTAPPASPGVSVRVPVAGGGTVDAERCAHVRIDGTAGDESEGECAAPHTKIVVVKEYVYTGAPARFAPDGERTALLAVSATGLAVGSLLLGGLYAAEMSKQISCQSQYVDYVTYGSGAYSYSRNQDCGTPLIPLLGYGATMALVPSIPRLALGDGRGWIWSSAIAGSIAIGKITDMATASDSTIGWGGAIFGYLIPTALGIVDLATTPHREDLRARSAGARITSIAPVVLSDRSGAHGGALSLAGAF